MLDQSDPQINAESLRAEAERLLSQESETPESESASEAPSDGGLKPFLARRFSEIIAKSIVWLWKPFFALGTFNLLEGEEGIGKTYLVCAIATAIARGFGLPMVLPEDHIEASDVLLISAEDSPEFVLKPRLVAMGAPCERIISIDEPFTLDGYGLDRLSMTLEKFKPKVVVMDPLFSYTGKINLDRDSDIRSVTDELKRLAEKYNCCIIGIRHIGKSKGFGDARNAGLNGVGWRASARSVLLIGKNPENDKQKALCQTKNNLAPIFNKSIGFEIVGDEFRWTGESSLTAEMMLSSSSSETGEEKSEKQDAVEFLRHMLRNGAVSAKQIFIDARKVGFSDSTLKRAKSLLSIKSEKRGGRFGDDPQEWVWRFPGDEGCQDAAEDAQIKSNEPLQANHSNKTSYSNGLAEEVQDHSSEHLLRNSSTSSNECPNCSCELSELPDGGGKFCPMGCGGVN